MKIKSKLQSGFTLVELIVSMCIISIMFGAILQVVSPTTKFFEKTSDFKDQVDISATLTNTIEAEIRYASNVLILEDYVGVPVVDNKNQLQGLPNVEFNTVLIIDNNNPRGSAFTDFDATSSASRRRGATGQVLKVDLYKMGINLKSSSLILSEAFFSDYTYELNATGNTDENGLGYVGFDTKIYNYSYNNGTYKYNKLEYNASEYLYLTNINLKDDDGNQFYVNKFNNSILPTDYNNYPQATVPGGVTTAQSKFYATDKAENSYTYIFYYKPQKTTSKVTLTFAVGDGGISDTNIKVTMGEEANIDPSRIPSLPIASKEIFYQNGIKYIRRFTGWCSTINGDPSNDDTWMQSDEFVDYVAIEDETFTAMYQTTTDTHKITFFDSAGLVVKGPIEKDSGLTLLPTEIPVIPSIPGHSAAWKIKDPSLVVEFDVDSYSFTEDIEVEYYYYENYTVKFYDDDTLTNQVGATETVKTGGSILTIPEVPTRTGYTGEWVFNESGTEKPPIYTNITSDMNIYAKYTAIPVDVPEVLVSKIDFLDWGDSVLALDITSTGSLPANNFTVTVTMKESVSGVTFCDQWGPGFDGVAGASTAISVSGNKIIIKCNNFQNFKNGNTFIIRMKVYPKLADYESIQITDIS